MEGEQNNFKISNPSKIDYIYNTNVNKGYNMQEYIELIQCFNDCNKFYWIDKLDISNSKKGYLLIYFNI